MIVEGILILSDPELRKELDIMVYVVSLGQIDPIVDDYLDGLFVKFVRSLLVFAGCCIGYPPIPSPCKRCA